MIILVIGLVLFGSSKLPQLGKGLGEAIRNFKKAFTEIDRHDINAGKKAMADNEKA